MYNRAVQLISFKRKHIKKNLAFLSKLRLIAAGSEVLLSIITDYKTSKSTNASELTEKTTDCLKSAETN